LDVLIDLPQSHDRFALGNRVVQSEIGAETVAIFHQHVPAKTEPGFFAFGFAVNDAVRIGRALVGLVATLLAVKIDGGVAWIVVFGVPHFLLVGAVLAHETFQAGPRLDERAVGGEMLVAGPV
jgi:hypothetical protein